LTTAAGHLGLNKANLFVVYTFFSGKFVAKLIETMRNFLWSEGQSSHYHAKVRDRQNHVKVAGFGQRWLCCDA